MTITAEQAQAELERRRSGSQITRAPLASPTAPASAPASAPAPAQTSGITQGQAQAELERRRSAGVENQPSLMQQLFDVKNADTGASYIYGNTPAPTQAEDLQRTVGDTISRGYLDKLRGPEAQAQTAAARERMPGWVETPTDIGAAVVSSPYRIGSMGVGALAGAAEGALSEYGHQDDWIPDSGEALDIAKGAGIGAVTGGVGAKVGGWLGGKAATKEAEAARSAITPDPNAIANADQILALKGMTRDDFAKALAGAPPELQAKIAEIAGGKGWTKAAADLIPGVVTKGGLGTTLLADLALGHAPTAVRTGAKVLKAAAKTDWANRVPDQEIEALAEAARRGELNIDPATINKWRDTFAKASIGYGREP